MILDGRKLRDAILEEVSREVSTLSFVPLFTDIVVGSDAASIQYAGMKKKTAVAAGFGYEDAFFPDSATDDEIIREIARLEALPHMAGIIVQLPLPKHLSQEKILNAISPRFDVDVLGQIANELFYENKSSLILPTAHAVMKLLEEAKVDYAHHSFVVIGRGALVGKPVIHLLEQKGCKLNIITRQTSSEEKEALLKNADVIISATGTAKLVTGDMIKEGAIVIDAGTSEAGGAIVGDVDFETVAPKASFITPCPGGVGPVTVACLFENVLAAAKML